jgi:transcription elongation GreA/GreB family factor
MSKPKKLQSKKQLLKTHKKEKIKRNKNKARRLKTQKEAVEERQLEKETFLMQEEIRKIQNKNLTIRKNKVGEHE